MLVYRITLRSYDTGLIHEREVYVDSRTNKAAEERLKRTFDNLVSFEYLRKDYIKYKVKVKPALDFKTHKKNSKLALLSEFLKDKISVSREQIQKQFNLSDKTFTIYINKLGFYYDKYTKNYVKVS